MDQDVDRSTEIGSSSSSRNRVGPDDEEEGSPEWLENVKSYLSSRDHTRDGETSKDAWDRFYQVYDPIIRGLARRSSRHGADFEDSVQEVWRVILVRLPSLRHDPGRGRLRAWLEVVARRALIDQARRRRRAARIDLLGEGRADDCDLASLSANPADDFERDCLVEEVRDALARYRERWPTGPGAEILRLRWLEGRDGAETAAALGLSIEQIWAHQNRALKRLAGLFLAPIPPRSKWTAAPASAFEPSPSRWLGSPPLIL